MCISHGSEHSLREWGGEIIMGNEEMAEELKKYFLSVLTVENTSNIPNYFNTREGTS